MNAIFSKQALDLPPTLCWAPAGGMKNFSVHTLTLPAGPRRSLFQKTDSFNTFYPLLLSSE